MADRPKETDDGRMVLVWIEFEDGWDQEEGVFLGLDEPNLARVHLSSEMYPRVFEIELVELRN